VLQRNLRALDQSAVLPARDHGLPIYVFDFNQAGAMMRVCVGEEEGTLIYDGEDALE
jgi:uridylate kinase